MKSIAVIVLTFAFTFTGNSQKEIYVSDAAGFNTPPWKILKYDENGQNGEVFIDHHLGWPQDILFLEDKGEVLISNLTTGTITRNNATDGSFINNFATGIAGPTRTKIGPDGYLYVLQWQGTGSIRRYTLEGDYLGTFSDVNVSTSIGLDWDSEGNLYVASFNGKFIQKISPNGTDLGKIISSNLAGPTNLWIDNNDDILVVDYSGGAVKRFSPSGILKSIFISNIFNAEGVAFMENGNILIGSGNSKSVKMYAEDGSYISDLISPSSSGLQTPNAVVIRNLSTVSTVDIDPKKVNLLSPSVGNIFSIKQETNIAFERCEIYNSSGQMIKTINIGQDTVWDASASSEGIYYLKAVSKDKDQFIQRIIVQH